MARASIARWTTRVWRFRSSPLQQSDGHSSQPHRRRARPQPGWWTHGVHRAGAFDFNDHAGYVSLFDGVSLKGWDGNPKFWRVENGAIVGESTPRIRAAIATSSTAISWRGTYAEVRDQGRRHRRQRDPDPQPDWAAVAGQHSGSGDRQRRAGQLELDDDGSAGRLLAEPVYTGQF